MKTNLYYLSVMQRRRPLTQAAFSGLMQLCSIPRMLLEVFIRRDFGERYFNFAIGILTACILCIIPISKPIGIRLLNPHATFPDFEILPLLLFDLTWYLFVAGFVAMCIDRKIEIQRQPNVFEFGRFSYSSGYINPTFLKLAPFGKPLSIRTIETIVEPGYFLIIGLILWGLQQHVGILLVFCSICYSVSYILSYRQGDHFVMDKIDQLICIQEISKTIIENLTPENTRGITIRARFPVDPEDRRKIVENLIVDDTVAVAK